MSRRYLLLVFGMLLFVPPLFAAMSTEEPAYAVAAQALDLAGEAKFSSWISSLPLAWTEPASVQSRLLPSVSPDLLRNALDLIRQTEDLAQRDDRLLWTRLALEASLGEIHTLPPYPMQRQDYRREWLDLAFYLGDLDSAETLLQSLEGEATDTALTYRRAVLASLRGQWLLADSLSREAVTDGLPLTSAVYKEMVKWGLTSSVVQPKLPSVLNSYLKTLLYLQAGEGNAGSWLYPEGYWRGQAAFLGGRYGEAIREWRSIHRPEFQGVLGTMIGEAYLRLGDYRQAQLLLQQVTKSYPKVMPAYHQLAMALEKQGHRASADHWRELGAKRSGSLFLLSGKPAISPATPLEARITVDKGTNILTVAGPWLQGAEGLWISGDRGQTWLWYPLLHSRIQLPKGNEFYLVSNGGSRVAERIVKVGNHNTSSGLLAQINTDGPLPRVTIQLKRSTGVVFEYWLPGGPRLRETIETPGMIHELFLSELESGALYRYRAFSLEINGSMELAEGSFKTADRPSWASVTTALSFTSTGERILSVRPALSADALRGKLRWRKIGSAWSDWSPLSLEASWSTGVFEDKQQIELQYQDGKGFILPIFHETFRIDQAKPRIDQIKRERSSSGETIFLRVNEPTVSRLWVRQAGVWKQSPGDDRWSKTHFLWIPSAAEEFRLWVEDRAGHLTSVSPLGSVMEERGAGPIPAAFRINGGDAAVSRRHVQLVLEIEEPVETADLKIRFSNGGGIWSPWEPWRAVKPWWLSAGDGDKVIHMQLRRGDVTQTMMATVNYESNPPVVKKFLLRPLGNNKIELTWQTDEPARCRWVLIPRQGSPEILEEEKFSQEHRMAVDLTDGEDWSWSVEAVDRSGNTATWQGGSLANGLKKAVSYPTTFHAALEQGSQRVKISFPEELKTSPVAIRWRRAMGRWSHWQPYHEGTQILLRLELKTQRIDMQVRTTEGHISPVMTQNVSLNCRPPRIEGVSHVIEPQRIRFAWRTDEDAESWLVIIAASGDWRQPIFRGRTSKGKTGMAEAELSNPGAYRGRIIAKDDAGNWSFSSEIPFRVE